MEPKNAVLIFELAKLLYTTFGRELLLDAVNDPNQKWDDAMMAALDFFFGVEK